MQQLQMAVEGMTCAHCVAGVRRALAALDGVQVEDVQIGSARVAYDPAHTRVDTIADAVRDEGYAVHVAAA